MIWKSRDPYRWRSRWAWRPRRIGDYSIWLEPYSVRLVPGAETRRRYPQPIDVRPQFLEEFRFGGRSAWRVTVLTGLAMAPPLRMWVSVRPELRAVA